MVEHRIDVRHREIFVKERYNFCFVVKIRELNRETLVAMMS